MPVILFVNSSSLERCNDVTASFCIASSSEVGGGTSGILLDPPLIQPVNNTLKAKMMLNDNELLF